MNVQTSRHAIAALAGAALFAASGMARATPSDGWDWMIAPYGWAATIGTDLESTSPPVSISTETRIVDLIDDLDGAFQVHAEGEGDEFGLFADISYLAIAGGRDRPLFRTESDLDARLYEVAAVWAPGPERGRGWHLFGGLRIVDVDFSVQFIPTNPAFPQASKHIGETLTDFMLGARYTWALSDRWALTLRGDGSWGDTEGSWNVSTVAQYRTRNGAWLFGYRYLDMELETGGDSIGMTMHGPEIGYAFRF